MVPSSLSVRLLAFEIYPCKNQCFLLSLLSLSFFSLFSLSPAFAIGRLSGVLWRSLELSGFSLGFSGARWGLDSRFLRACPDVILLLLSSYEQMMILRLCGSGVRFQVFDSLFRSHSFAIKLLLTNDDSEALWLKGQIPGF